MIRILDAPNIKDDFYCSVLAYSDTCQTLAMGLGNDVFMWTETFGAHRAHRAPDDGGWITSMSFSSEKGRRSILAVGRVDGSLVLQSTYDALPRFELQQPYGVSCVSWRPACTPRSSKNPLNPGVRVQTEELIVGDERGTMYYYVVEWPLG